MTILVRDLGPLPHELAVQRMRTFVAQRIAARPKGIEDEIWLTEHPPVFTLGRNASRAHLIAPGEIPVVATERGGDVTYHGPGQIVAYLMLDLPRRGLGVRRLVEAIEEALIGCLGGIGIDARRRAGAPGIYVSATGEKIASIGIKVSRGFSWHGVALNADMDLAPFGRIDPCGYPDLKMTDIRTRLSAIDGQSSVAATVVDLKALRSQFGRHLVAALDR